MLSGHLRFFNLVETSLVQGWSDACRVCNRYNMSGRNVWDSQGRAVVNPKEFRHEYCIFRLYIQMHLNNHVYISTILLLWASLAEKIEDNIDENQDDAIAAFDLQLPIIGNHFFLHELLSSIFSDFISLSCFMEIRKILLY